MYRDRPAQFARRLLPPGPNRGVCTFFRSPSLSQESSSKRLFSTRDEIVRYQASLFILDCVHHVLITRVCVSSFSSRYACIGWFFSLSLFFPSTNKIRRRKTARVIANKCQISACQWSEQSLDPEMERRSGVWQPKDSTHDGHILTTTPVVVVCARAAMRDREE